MADGDPGLSFRWEWLPGEAMRSPELSATFARLEIHVGDHCVTLVQDEDSGSSRRSVQVSLYPLAEWIAFNWWTLLANARPARRATLPGGRHALRSSADGFLWPDLTIVPEGHTTRVTWRADRTPAPGASIRYLTDGEVLTPSNELERRLGSFVSAVVDRLVEQDVRGSALQEEWTAVTSTDREEADFCLAAARLGLDPYAEAPEFEEQILEASTVLPASLLDVFYDAVDPRAIETTVGWVLAALDTSGRARTLVPQTVLRNAVGGGEAPGRHPWRLGWEQARAARAATGHADTVPFDLGRFLRSVTEDGPVHVKAAGWAGSSASPLVVFPRAMPRRSTRFTLARCLWHQAATGDDAFLVTDSYTDRQKIERAFAAELLAPAAGIRSLLPVAPEEAQGEDVETIADEFEVATTLIELQIENQLVG